MKEYGRESVRNIALVAPHGAGKTSLAEALLFLHGATDKQAKVDDGSSVLDYESEEKHRRMSINSHVAFFETKTHLINLIDTPGFLNFLYETENALRVVDGAVIVVGAVGGDVAVQVRKYWDMTGDLPKIIFINKLDRENTSLDATLGSLSKELKVKLLPLTFPIGQHHDFKGVIDVIEMKAYKYGGGANYEEIPIPGGYGGSSRVPEGEGAGIDRRARRRAPREISRRRGYRRGKDYQDAPRGDTRSEDIPRVHRLRDPHGRD